MTRFRTMATAWVGALMIGAFASAAFAAEPATLEARVKQIEDRAAIERVLMEYGRSLDNRDFATYSHLFAANGEWSGGFGTFRGPAAIQAAMEKAFAGGTDIPKGTNFHILTNAIIDVQGDRATAASKWLFVKMDKSKPEATLAGRYDDLFVRENGVWKFQQRVAKLPGDK
jgi:ketosteroid isomerase-like protein